MIIEVKILIILHLIFASNFFNGICNLAEASMPRDFATLCTCVSIRVI